MSVEFSSHSGVEIAHDQSNNLWFTFPNTKEQISLLHGLCPETAVVTPLGRELLLNKDRRQVIRKIANGGLSLSGFVGQGTEGRVEKVIVPPKNNVLEGGGENLVVEKKLTPEESEDFCLAWETVQLFDFIRPDFTENEFKLIEPFGATSRSLFLPYLESVDIRAFLFNIDPFNKVLKLFTEDIETLESSIKMRLADLMLERDYDVLERTEKNVGLECGDESGSVYFILDVRKIDKDLKKCSPVFENWLFPKSAAKEMKQYPLELYSPEEIYKLFKESVVCLDPFLAYRIKY